MMLICLLLMFIYDQLLMSVVKKSLNLLIFSVNFQEIFLHQCHSWSPGQFSPWDFCNNFLSFPHSQTKENKKGRQSVSLSTAVVIAMALHKTPCGAPASSWHIPHIFSSHSTLCTMWPLCVLPHLTFCPTPHHNGHGVCRCTHLLVLPTNEKIPEDKSYILFILMLPPLSLKIKQQGFS